jgi:aspartate beta-hydroxylase
MNIAAEARELLRQGRIPEAESAFMRVLEASPDHVEALNMLALAALRGGRVRQALDLLNRAAGSDPADAITQHHLGRAFEAAGDLVSALRAFETAVRLRPDFSVARLYWAASLERAGRIGDAVVQYAKALEDAQKGGQWLSPESTPPALRALVEHAVLAVRENRNLAFAKLFEPLLERFGRESLTRVAQILRIYFKQESPVYGDPRQRPTFLFMPGLPTAPYLDRQLFPWMKDLESETGNIRSELRIRRKLNRSTCAVPTPRQAGPDTIFIATGYAAKTTAAHARRRREPSSRCRCRTCGPMDPRYCFPCSQPEPTFYRIEA